MMDIEELPSRKPRRTQAERAAESDARILDAAIHLIATQGYSATTLEAIGAEAGYSRQLVSQRFGSKDKLLETMIANHALQLNERAQAMRKNLTGLQSLFVEIDTYLRALDSPSIQSRAFFVLMLESVGPAPQFRAAYAAVTARWEERLVEQIEAGQQQGSVRSDIDARTEARLLIATLRGIRVQSLMDPESSAVLAAMNALKVGLAERLLSRRPPPQ